MVSRYVFCAPPVFARARNDDGQLTRRQWGVLHFMYPCNECFPLCLCHVFGNQGVDRLEQRLAFLRRVDASHRFFRFVVGEGGEEFFDVEWLAHAGKRKGKVARCQTAGARARFFAFAMSRWGQGKWGDRQSLQCKCRAEAGVDGEDVLAGGDGGSGGVVVAFVVVGNGTAQAVELGAVYCVA